MLREEGRLKGKDQNDRARDGSLPSDPEADARPMIQDSPVRAALAKSVEGSSEPHDVQAEASLLGMLLWCGAYAPETVSLTSVADLVSSVDAFFAKPHALVFEAMLSLTEQSKAIDSVTVHGELLRRRQDKVVGGLEALESLVSLADSCSVTRARSYAESIRDAWLRRRLIASADATIRQCREGRVRAGEAVAEAIESIRPIGEAITSDSDVISLKDSIKSVFRTLLQGEKVDYLSSGFRDLDRILAGYFAKETTIVAARTSVGKTAFATQSCKHVVRTHKGVAVLYFSLEMPAQSFTKRLLASEAMIDGHALRRGDTLSPLEVSRITSASQDLAKLPIYFAESPTQTIFSIHSIAKAWAAALARDGLRIGIIVIDHIGLIKPSSRAVNRERREQVGETSRGLRFLANEHGCHVMALCQINRGAESKKMPTLADLKDSGSIEEDADNVIILHRDKDEMGQFVPNRPAWVSVAKGRNDGTGLFQLGVEPRYLRFSDWNG